MGLDMYLKCNSKVLTEKMHESAPYGEYITDYYTRTGVVVYWRKANAIHKWLVDHVQDGNDDCGTYEVSYETLYELMTICECILEECPLVEEPSDTSLGKIGNVKRATELLPTTDGFFFGGTDYDGIYHADVEWTAKQLRKLLNEVRRRDNGWGGFYIEANTEPGWEVTFTYHASW